MSLQKKRKVASVDHIMCVVGTTKSEDLIFSTTADFPRCSQAPQAVFVTSPVSVSLITLPRILETGEWRQIPAPHTTVGVAARGGAEHCGCRDTDSHWPAAPSRRCSLLPSPAAWRCLVLAGPHMT